MENPYIEISVSSPELERGYDKICPVCFYSRVFLKFIISYKESYEPN